MAPRTGTARVEASESFISCTLLQVPLYVPAAPEKPTGHGQLEVLVGGADRSTKNTNRQAALSGGGSCRNGAPNIAPTRTRDPVPGHIRYSCNGLSSSSLSVCHTVAVLLSCCQLARVLTQPHRASPAFSMTLCV